MSAAVPTGFCAITTTDGGVALGHPGLSWFTSDQGVIVTVAGTTVHFEHARGDVGALDCSSRAFAIECAVALFNELCAELDR